MPDTVLNTTVTEEAKQQQTPDVPDYSQDEIAYLGGLQIRLERAGMLASHHDEFNGMTYSQINLFILPDLLAQGRGFRWQRYS